MQAFPTLPARPALEKLLKDAAKVELSPGEIYDQRVSFVYGNLPFKSKITRKEVEASIVKMYGPRPLE